MNKNESMDVYCVIEAEGNRQDFWMKLGRAFPHKNGDGGFNILLNALPIGTNKLVVKPRKVKAAATTRGGTWVDDSDPNACEYEDSEFDSEIPF